MQDGIEDGLVRQSRWKSTKSRGHDEPQFGVSDRPIEYHVVKYLLSGVLAKVRLRFGGNALEHVAEDQPS